MRTFYLFLFLFASKISVAQTKVGVVNSKKVLEALPYRDSMIRVIQQIEKEGIQELSSMDSLLQNRFKCQLNSGCFIDPLTRMTETNTIQTLQKQIQIREKEIDSQLMVLVQELNKTSLSIVKKAVQLVSESTGISLVYDESTLLYFEDQLDITEQVIQQALK